MPYYPSINTLNTTQALFQAERSDEIRVSYASLNDVPDYNKRPDYLIYIKSADTYYKWNEDALVWEARMSGNGGTVDSISPGTNILVTGTADIPIISTTTTPSFNTVSLVDPITANGQATSKLYVDTADTSLQNQINTKIENATNNGTGTGLIFRDKTTTNLNFKSLNAGTAISLVNNTDDITINSSAITLITNTDTKLVIDNTTPSAPIINIENFFRFGNGAYRSLLYQYNSAGAQTAGQIGFNAQPGNISTCTIGWSPINRGFSSDMESSIKELLLFISQNLPMKIKLSDPLVDGNYFVLSLDSLLGTGGYYYNFSCTSMIAPEITIATHITNLQYYYLTFDFTNKRYINAQDALLQTQITTNASNISTNTTNISTNATDISALTTAFNNRVLDGNTDVTITAPVATDLLAYNGTGWVNAKGSDTLNITPSVLFNAPLDSLITGNTQTQENSTNALIGTLNNLGAVNLVAGKLGNAIQFLSVANQYITFPYASYLDFTVGSQFTINFWFNSTQSSSTQRIMCGAGGGSNASGWWITSTGANHRISFQMADAATTRNLSIDWNFAAGTIFNGQWHLLTVTHGSIYGGQDDGDVHLYLDGVLRDDVRNVISNNLLVTDDIQSGVPFTIGNLASGFATLQDTIIDNLTIFNFRMTEMNVYSLYNGGTGKATYTDITTKINHVHNSNDVIGLDSALVSLAGKLENITNNDGTLQITGTTTKNIDVSLITAAKGGSGFSSYTTGDILSANSTTTLTKIQDVAVGNVLLSGGVGVLPSYGKVNLTTAVSGALPILNGGTAATTILDARKNLAFARNIYKTVDLMIMRNSSNFVVSPNYEFVGTTNENLGLGHTSTPQSFDNLVVLKLPFPVNMTCQYYPERFATTYRNKWSIAYSFASTADLSNLVIGMATSSFFKPLSYANTTTSLLEGVRDHTNAVYKYGFSFSGTSGLRYFADGAGGTGSGIVRSGWTTDSIPSGGTVIILTQETPNTMGLHWYSASGSTLTYVSHFIATMPYSDQYQSNIPYQAYHPVFTTNSQVITAMCERYISSTYTTINNAGVGLYNYTDYYNLVY